MAKSHAEPQIQVDDDLACDMCDGSGWLIWRTATIGEDYEAHPVALFVACADCNDDAIKPYPAPWPVCVLCEQQTLFCHCGPILIH